MGLPDLRPWASLLLADWALLRLLQGTLDALLPGGLLGQWLEGTLRLGGLWCLLKLGGLLAPAGTLLPALCLAPPLFLSLRALSPGALSAPPASVAAAPWSWLLAGYGAAALSWAVWAVLSPPGAPEREQGQGKSQALMWRLLKLSRPDLPFLAAAFFFLVVAVLGEMLIPYYSGRVIDILGGDFDPEAFASAIFFMCLFSFGSSLSAGCRGGCFLFTMSRINLRIREQLFSSLLHQDLSFFQETKTGELNSRLNSDTKLMSSWLPLNANVLLRSLVKVVGLYSFMLNLSPRLTLLSLFEVPLTIAAEKVYNGRHQAVLLEIQDAVAQAGQVVREAVGGLKTVRSFGAEEHEACRYEEALERCRKLWWQRDLERALYLLFRRMLHLAMQVLMLNCGLRQILAGDLTRGGLLSFLLFQEDLGHHVQVRQQPRMLSPSLCFSLWPLGLGIYWFSLKTQDKTKSQLIARFTLRPGQMTALVGPNGSGKSTVAALLQNLYQPTAGTLLLDGKPLAQYEHRYLHRQVAVVGQEPVLFSGSVRDNIAYGLQRCSEEEVMAAARAAQADEFIKEMAHGLHTDVGEKGNLLAVGQKQRLAIARALVRDPRVLILDEATSALDVQCEQALQDWRCRRDRTVLVIAHRLQTVQRADQVLVLRQGQLLEREQLRAGQDLYSRLAQQLEGWEGLEGVEGLEDLED
ncbi:antigen peptide transporter 2 [Myotis lucifugus]|uniref:antigen peptide transporter 2 n=1 Tax=Myotis lucifugus TaxID=59463 RepID=UPI000CCC2E57|nr:antigen peptide transporter 2 [Myotis lucifugus]